MKIRQFATLTLLMAISSIFASDCDDIAFEENDCIEVNGEVRCHRHYHLPDQSLEERHFWQEQTDSSWAGKRDDNFIDNFLHQ